MKNIKQEATWSIIVVHLFQVTLNNLNDQQN